MGYIEKYLVARTVERQKLRFSGEYDEETYDILDTKGLKYFIFKWPEHKVKTFIGMLKDDARSSFYFAIREEMLSTQWTTKELEYALRFFPEDDIKAKNSRRAIYKKLTGMEETACVIC